MEETKKCPKCDSQMDKGLMLTAGAIVGVRWHKGEPGLLGAIVAKHPKIWAYKCVKCGYLENYVE
jgi:ribosomal protein S27AE